MSGTSNTAMESRAVANVQITPPLTGFGRNYAADPKASFE